MKVLTVTLKNMLAGNFFVPIELLTALATFLLTGPGKIAGAGDYLAAAEVRITTIAKASNSLMWWISERLNEDTRTPARHYRNPVFYSGHRRIFFRIKHTRQDLFSDTSGRSTAENEAELLNPFNYTLPAPDLTNTTLVPVTEPGSWESSLTDSAPPAENILTMLPQEQLRNILLWQGR